MHTEYWLHIISHLSYFLFNFYKTPIHTFELIFVSFVCSPKFPKFDSKRKKNRYDCSKGYQSNSPRRINVIDDECVCTQMRNDQSTCPHLACSTWMELIAGLNVGIVRKKVKGKATCWKQKLSWCEREEGVSKEGRQLWHWQWPSFSYTVGRALASTFPRKNWMKWNCTRSCTRIRYVGPNRWNNGRIRRVWQRRR